MGAIFEIPLKSATPQKLHVSLGATDFTLWLTWNTQANGGAGLWMLQIGDTNETILVSGIPLVTGSNLLAQFHYLGIPGSLVCQGAGDPDSPPAWADLGVGSHLFWVGP